MFTFMDLEQLAEYRVGRLQELLDQKYGGSKAALGRALGYRDGAFVGQMLRKERPITEKTVDQIHALPNGRKWFANLEAHQPALVPAKGPVHALAEMFEEYGTAEKETATQLLALLLNNPKMKDAVAQGLEDLLVQARAGQSKQIVATKRGRAAA